MVPESRLIGGALALACCGVGMAAEDLSTRYAKAVEFLPWIVQERIHGPSIETSASGLRLHLEPQWLSDGASFWYTEHGREKQVFYRVDPARATRTALAEAPPHEREVSPGGKWSLRLENGNLFVDARQLTFDAVADYAYGVAPSNDESLNRKRTGSVAAVPGVWSPDGNRFLTYRVDERRAYKMPFLLSTVPGQRHQFPWVHMQNTHRPGDEVPRLELSIFDARDGRRVDLEAPGPMDILYYARLLEWSADGRTVFTSHESRDFRKITIYASDVETGKARIVAEDRGELPLRGSRRSSRQALIVGNGREIVLYSERDG